MVVKILKESVLKNYVKETFNFSNHGSVISRPLHHPFGRQYG